MPEEKDLARFRKEQAAIWQVPEKLLFGDDLKGPPPPGLFPFPLPHLPTDQPE